MEDMLTKYQETRKLAVSGVRYCFTCPLLSQSGRKELYRSNGETSREKLHTALIRVCTHAETICELCNASNYKEITIFKIQSTFDLLL